MKRLFSISALLAALACAGVAAGPALTEDPFKFSNVTTNSSANVTGSVVTNAVRISGDVRGVACVFSGASSPSVHVKLTTTAAGAMGLARVVFEKTAVTSNQVFMVTTPKCSTGGTANSNDGATIPLYSEVVTCSAYAANKTNVNVTVYLLTQ